MFERPLKTLERSLFNVLENAQEYIADVCFIYPTSQVVWAHKAILLARVPKLFRNKYMPQLDVNKCEEPTISIDISVVIPYTILRQLLRFWYIADFSAPFDDSSFEIEENIRNGIKQLELKLSMTLLTISTNNLTENEQWIMDLKRMMDEKIATDVVVNIFNVPSSSTTALLGAVNNKSLEENTTVNSISFLAHRFILASQSPYFYAVFCTEFREASTSSVHMPSDLFSSTTLQVILHYFYTDTLILPPFISSRKEQSHHTKLNEKKHELRILQKVFTAADFLGHFNTICKAALLKISIICHHFKCVCSDCSILLPSMLLFADKNEKYVPRLRSKLISLYADPLDSLAPLWSQKPFAILVNSMSLSSLSSQQPNITKTNKNDGVEVISQIFNSKVVTTTLNVPATNSDTASSNQSLSSASTNTVGPSTSDLNLIAEITERTFANITKHNSVRVLHSLHLCLSYIRGADPFPTWSQPTLNILNQFVHSTVDMISSNFDYYCVEYPILLSCVDGIGFGFSVDFLGFVLKRVLTEGIHDGNAAVLYQGIVRDLGGRQEMVRNVAVDSVLLDARVKCAHYISKRWIAVKAEGGFLNIEKEVLRLLSEDINVPTRTLNKPLETDFSTIFSSFKKPGATKQQKDETMTAPVMTNNSSASSSVSQQQQQQQQQQLKRLSFGSSAASMAVDETLKTTRNSRTRSLSASTTSHESILKKDVYSSPHHSDTEDIVIFPRRKHMPTYRAYKRNESTGSLTDALLPIEIKDNNNGSSDKKEENAPARPTRLRFALPDTPSRTHPKAPGQRLSAIQNSASSNAGNNGLNMAQKSAARKKSRRAKSPGKSRWSLGYSTSDSSDDEQGNAKKKDPMVGQKIELLRRPLPTQGTIRYIGDVEFSKGVWVGVELESRLGNNDGSVDGKRYFQTFPQRGVFVKIDDFKIIAPAPEKKLTAAADKK